MRISISKVASGPFWTWNRRNRKSPASNEDWQRNVSKFCHIGLAPHYTRDNRKPIETVHVRLDVMAIVKTSVMVFMVLKLC